MRALFLVMLGGSLGTALRYGVGLWVSGPSPTPGAFPWATLLVNVAGCFALGLLSETVAERPIGGVPARLVVGTGLLGGFTTYSAFNTEVLRLAERGDTMRAALYFGTTLTLCVGAGIGGLALGRWARSSLGTG